MTEEQIKDKESPFAAVGKSPWGPAVPLGAALTWAISMMNTSGAQIVDIKDGQVQMQIQMAEVSHAVAGNTNELDKRSESLISLERVSRDNRSAIALQEREAQHMRATLQALEARVSKVEAER